MKDPIVLSNAARSAALEHLGVALGNEFAPNAIASNNLGAHHGQVCLANDSLLRQSEYIEELTTFAISYDGMVGMPKPIVKAILKQTGLTEDEFLVFLNQS